MKFRNMATLALCGVLSLAASPVLAAKERPVRLTMTTQYMDRHPIVQKVFKPWIEEVKNGPAAGFSSPCTTPTRCVPKAKFWTPCSRDRWTSVSISAPATPAACR